MSFTIIFSPCPGWVFVVVDAYDISLKSREVTSSQYQEAVRIIKSNTNNPVCWEEGTGDYFSGLLEDEKDTPKMRFVPFNGGIGKQQLHWLEEVLFRASGAHDKVIIFSHIPISDNNMSGLNKPSSCTLLYNYKEVLNLISRINTPHKTVVAVFSGHQHEGAYGVENEVHHVTFQSPLIFSHCAPTYATVQLYADHINITGSGGIPSRVLSFC